MAGNLQLILTVGNRSNTLSETQDLVDALAPVVTTLEKLGIRYFIGGSVASSFHGAVRSTMDVDLVCELTEADVPSLLKEFGDDYYVSDPGRDSPQLLLYCFSGNETFDKLRLTGSYIPGVLE